MTARRRATGFGFARARHRGPGVIHRAVLRGTHGVIVSAAAAMIVMVMVTSDPGIQSRA